MASVGFIFYIYENNSALLIVEGAGAVRMCQTEFLFVVINKVQKNSVLGRVLPANVVILHHAQQEQKQNYLDTSNCSETS